MLPHSLLPILPLPHLLGGLTLVPAAWMDGGKPPVLPSIACDAVDCSSAVPFLPAAAARPRNAVVAAATATASASATAAATVAADVAVAVAAEVARWD